MSDFEIVRVYGAEFRGIVNYYSLAENVSKMFYHLKEVAISSAVTTLAYKHKTTAKRIYRKYRQVSEHGVRALIVELPNPNNPEKPYRAKLGEQPIRRDRKAIIRDEVWQSWFSRTELTQRLLADQCELCGCGNDVQVHHVRKLADIEKRYRGRKTRPKWVSFMMERKRKTVVVCGKCHKSIHTGTYDGPRVKSD